MVNSRFVIQRPEWLPYVLPMAVFLGLTSLEGMLPKEDGGEVAPALYAVAYAVKALLVSIAVVACRSVWGDYSPRPSIRVVAVAVFLGLCVTALWVTVPSPALPLLGSSGDRVGFDPNRLSGPVRYLFLAARFYGLVLLVPFVEELFWRSFLMRWVIDQDFTRVSVGTVTPVAAGVVSALFALAHPEWLPALLTGLIWAGLLWKTKSLSACFVSHLVANLALGVYILAKGAWGYW
ncbi:MAG: CAAX prenyl protease-related protein [Isosphaeraceae bacterium]|nr:CAAX prenyl protease-related protein [Isosphaeraceae bacterium]